MDTCSHSILVRYPAAIRLFTSRENAGVQQTLSIAFQSNFGSLIFAHSCAVGSPPQLADKQALTAVSTDHSIKEIHLSSVLASPSIEMVTYTSHFFLGDTTWGNGCWGDLDAYPGGN